MFVGQHAQIFLLHQSNDVISKATFYETPTLSPFSSHHFIILAFFAVEDI